jgi:hypothetical protein
MFQGEHRRAWAGRDADLPVDVLDMVLGRAAGDMQVVRYLRVGAPRRYEAEDLNLPIAEARWRGRASGRRTAGGL